MIVICTDKLVKFFRRAALEIFLGGYIESHIPSRSCAIVLVVSDDGSRHAGTSNAGTALLFASEKKKEVTPFGVTSFVVWFDNNGFILPLSTKPSSQ